MNKVVTLAGESDEAADPPNVHRLGTYLRNRGAGMNREAIPLGHRFEARLWRRLHIKVVGFDKATDRSPNDLFSYLALCGDHLIAEAANAGVVGFVREREKDQLRSRPCSATHTY
jgi:hypothetical protein